MLNKIIAGEGIFKDISYILFTHAHKDHYNEQETLNYVLNNRTKAIFALQESGKLKKIKKEAKNKNIEIININDAYKREKEKIFKDVKIKYFRIAHSGKQFRHVNNYGYIINIKGITLLHLGDGDFDKETLGKVLIDEKIDYAFLNFPYVNLPEGREIINKLIKPKKVFIIHLPFQEDDLYNYAAITLKVIERHKQVLPETKVLLEPLEEIELY